MNHLFYKQRLRQMLFILFDVVIVFVSAYFALMMRFTFGVFPLEYQVLLVRCLPFDIILTVGVFWFFKLYHSIWAFASVNELVKIFQAVAVVNGLELIYKVFFQFNMPRSFYILNFGFMLILVLLSRLSLRVIYYYKGGKKPDSGVHRKRTMVIGAGATQIGRASCRERV